MTLYLLQEQGSGGFLPPLGLVSAPPLPLVRMLPVPIFFKDRPPCSRVTQVSSLQGTFRQSHNGVLALQAERGQSQCLRVMPGTGATARWGRGL